MLYSKPWTFIKAAIARPEKWFILGVVVLSLALFVFHEPLSTLMSQGKDVVTWVRSFGSLAPLAYIGLYVAQIVVAPIPGNVVSFMGGYLFGTVWGTVYSLVGVELGALGAAGIARLLGRPIIERLIDKQKLEHWERRLRVRSPITWMLILVPPVPDALYYVAGLSGMPLKWLGLAVLIGRAPMVLVSNWFGAQAVALSTETFVALSLAVVVILFVLSKRERQLRLFVLLAWRRGRDLTRRNVFGK